MFRHDDVPLGALAAEACRLAIADAGLEPSQIDGVACAPTQPFALEGRTFDGLQFVTTEFVTRALDLEPKWNVNHPGNLGHSVVEAINSVETGLCNFSLIFRALHSPSRSYGLTTEEVVGGSAQLLAPYGSFAPAVFGQMWHAYQDKYHNGTREQMATYVVQARHHGLLYEGSYWSQHRSVELSVDDYLTARLVSTPLSVYDCDIPVQGCSAFIVTTADRAVDLPHSRPMYVASGCQHPGSMRAREARRWRASSTMVRP